MTAPVVAMLLVTCVMATACAPVEAPGPPVASFVRSRCGRCHSPPVAAIRDRAYVESALSRHEKRVHLTPEEMTDVAGYLSKNDGAK